MQLQSEFTIKHVNIRREKAGEEQGPVAVDIRLGAKIAPAELHGLFATQASFDRILGQLWNDEDELTTSDLDKITLQRAGVGRLVDLIPQVSNDKLRLEGADVNKITLKPEAGRLVDVSLRVQAKPTKEQIARLSEWLGCSLNVAVSQRQAELPLQSGAAEQDAGEAPDPDRAAVQQSVQDLAAAGVLKVSSPAAGAEDGAVVPGQRPPQRPKKAAADKTTH